MTVLISAFPSEAWIGLGYLFLTALGMVGESRRHRAGLVPKLVVKATPAVVMDLPDSGDLLPTFNVQIANTSTAPVKIEAVSVELPDKRCLLLRRNYMGPSLPMTLGHNESFTFIQPLDDLEEGWRRQGFETPMQTRAVVTPNVGKPVKSKRVKVQSYADV